MKHIQNNQKSIGKTIPAYGFLKSQERNLHTKRLLLNVCDFQKETIPQGMDLKVYRKSVALPMEIYSL